MGEPKNAKPSADEAAEQPLLDMLARRAGLEIPAERRAGVSGVLASLLRTAALLHADRAPTNWSGQVYQMETVLRARDRQP